MTKEERIAKMAELRAKVEADVASYNEAMQEEKYDEATKLDEAISENVGEYTANARKLCFNECAESEDGPMMAAVKRRTYDSIAVKDTKKEDEKIPVRTVEDVKKPIDLIKLDKHCNGIGVDKSWYHMAQKFNFLLTAQKAKDLGVDPRAINDSYEMSEIAKAYDLGKNPASNTNLLKTLQALVSAMLGEEYRALSHDVNYLTSVYSKKGRKALSVSCANHRYFVGYIADICHRIVTGKKYDVEFRAKKSA